MKFFNETNKVSHSISQKITAAIVRDSDAAAPSKPIQNGSQKRDTTNKGVTTSSSGAGIFLSSVDVIFSGKTTISTPDSNFVIPSHSSKTVNYVVGDSNGNPLTSGSTIQVSVSGSAGVAVTGDVNVTLPDVQDKGFTHYRVIAKDTSTTGSHPTGAVNLNIVVVSPNGSKSLLVNGMLLGGSATDSGKVGKISLVNTATDTVVVNGGGGSSSTQVQFKVYDVFNNPAKNIPINFALTQTVNGGEYLSPQSAVSDSNGNVSTTFKSGIRSGTVQLVAQAKQDSANIISSGVKSVYIKTGAIQSIALINVSTQQLSIRSVGGTESASMIFEGRDSLGNPIDFSNQTLISFKLQGDTAGAFISPNSVKTDPVTGRVTTSISGGPTPGVLQVYASAKSDSVKSSPVRFTIASGLPDSAHFNVIVGLSPSIPQFNYGVPSTAFANVYVAAGDTFGNPAQAGTSIYFTTNAGNVDPSGSLDQNGNAVVTWRFALNPKPANSVAWVTARTVNGHGKFVLDTVRVFLTYAPIIDTLVGPFANFQIPHGLSQAFTFRVADLNGNPLAQGTTISVTASGAAASQVLLSGDVNKVLNDTKIAGLGSTLFSVTIADTTTGAGQSPKPLTLTISVTGPNTPSGAVSRSFNGVLQGSSSTGGGKVSQVAVVGKLPSSGVNPSIDSLTVTGGGGVSSEAIQFQVLDFYNRSDSKYSSAIFNYSICRRGRILQPHDRYVRRKRQSPDNTLCRHPVGIGSGCCEGKEGSDTCFQPEVGLYTDWNYLVDCHHQCFLEQSFRARCGRQRHVNDSLRRERFTG